MPDTQIFEKERTVGSQRNQFQQPSSCLLEEDEEIFNYGRGAASNSGEILETREIR